MDIIFIPIYHFYLTSRMIYKKYIFILLSFILLSFILFISRVDNSITNEDKEYIKIFIGLEKKSPSLLSYTEQLELIKLIQKSVLTVAAPNIGIEKRKTREPKDLYLKKAGLCFDRSRVIEKILRYYGFKTRHISIYSTKETGSILKSLVTPGIKSHALSEVKTSKGWLVIDSNEEWVALDNKNQPISISEIIKNKKNIKARLLNDFPSFIFDENFFVIYGLYSRHGMYYPPFNIIPDINYSEFLYNLQFNLK